MSLIVGIAWPLTVVGVLLTNRVTVRRLLGILEWRFARDKVTGFGLTLEPPDPKLGLPLLNPPADSSSSGKANLLVQVLAAAPSDPVLLVLGESYHTDPSSAVGTGDALGLAAVQAALLRADINNVSAAVIRSRYANIADVLREHKNIVSLGGPWGNKLSHAVTAALNLNYSFQDDYVFDATTKESYYSAIDKGLNGTDYGVIVAAQNPFNVSGRFVMAAGYHAFGTFAAASILSAAVPSSLQPLIGRPFEALVRAQIKVGVVCSSEVISARAIEPPAA